MLYYQENHALNIENQEYTTCLCNYTVLYVYSTRIVLKFDHNWMKWGTSTTSWLVHAWTCVCVLRSVDIFGVKEDPCQLENIRRKETIKQEE